MNGLKVFFGSPAYGPARDFAFLVIRIVVGVAFMLHGWGKIQHPFNWMGPHAFAPPFLQFLAAISEFLGGLAFIIGLLTRLASLGILCTMAVAIWTMVTMFHAPFVPTTATPGTELPATYLCIALVLLTFGAGGFSLDHLFFSRTRDVGSRVH